MARIAVLHHNEEIGVGRLGPFLARHRGVDVWAPDAEFPDAIDAVVVMGGFMGAYETEEHPWLRSEGEWLAKQVADSTPVLGICLGAQLLADVLGGRAFKAERPEVGVVEVSLTEEGRRHPVVKHMGQRAFFAHQDTFDVPPDATLLAETVAYPAAFELGSALGIQPHPETPVEEAVTWVDDPRFDMPERAGVTRTEYIEGVEQQGPEADRVADDMFGAWFGRLDTGDR